MIAKKKLVEFSGSQNVDAETFSEIANSVEELVGLVEKLAVHSAGAVPGCLNKLIAWDPDIGLDVAIEADDFDAVVRAVRAGAGKKDCGREISCATVAAMHDRPKILRFLLRDDPERVHEKCSSLDEHTALAWSVINGSEECLDVLLMAGADPNEASSTGFTALHAAARDERASMLAKLLAVGADPHKKNDRGHSPLDYAVRNGSRVAIFYMTKHPSIASKSPPEETK